MRTCALVLIGVFIVGPAAMAEITFLPGNGGACPFTNYAGTGTITQNATARGANVVTGDGWYDWNMGDTTPYLLRSVDIDGKPTNSMYYQETWGNVKHDVGTVMIIGPGRESRNTAGSIYVQKEAGGEWVWVEDFNVTYYKLQFISINQKDIYGVKIDVTGPVDANGKVNDGYYQIGSLAFFQEPIAHFDNIAAGRPGFFSGGTMPYANAVTDEHFQGDRDNTRFTSNGSAEQYVGLDFDGSVQLQGLLIGTCAVGEAAWGWHNFDVQIYRTGEGWIDIGRANAAGTDLYWVDFGPDGVWAEKVRLYGCSADFDEDRVGGNNGNSKIITQIMAFEFVPVPEPATMSLLTLGGLALLRRRK